MRYAAVTAFVITLTGLVAESAQAGGMPGHWMNPHPPFIISSRYWHPGPYRIWGPTDHPLQPVQGIGPPPFGPRSWYQQPVIYAGGYVDPIPQQPGGLLAGPYGGRAFQPPQPNTNSPGAPCPPGGPCGPRWWRSPRDYFMYPIP